MASLHQSDASSAIMLVEEKGWQYRARVTLVVDGIEMSCHVTLVQ